MRVGFILGITVLLNVSVGADYSDSACLQKQEIIMEKTQLLQCLQEVYGLEGALSEKIAEKFSYFFKHAEHQHLIDDFIALLEGINLMPVQAARLLGEYDARIKAPEFHHLLFENEKFRILESVVPSGSTAPLHTHEWDSIVVILQGSCFEVKDVEGTMTEDNDSRCLVEKTPGNSTPYSFTNSGTQEYRGLVFEIKG